MSVGLLGAGVGALVPRPVAWRFYVQVDGILYGEFTECTGLSMQRETQDFAEGGLNDKVHKLPGRIKYDNITLRRGMITPELWFWCMGGDLLGMSGRPNLRNIFIFLATDSGVPYVTWVVNGAYPTRWSGPSLKTDSKELAIEEIQLAHHGLTLIPL
jgi:phage tail-like protein